MLKKFMKNFGLTKTVRKGNLINPHMKMFTVVIKNQPGILHKILGRLKNLDINVNNLESDFLINDNQSVKFNFSYDGERNVWENIKSNLEDLNARVE